jgi:hypothetical protein
MNGADCGNRLRKHDPCRYSCVSCSRWNAECMNINRSQQSTGRDGVEWNIHRSRAHLCQNIYIRWLDARWVPGVRSIDYPREIYSAISISGSSIISRPSSRPLSRCVFRREIFGGTCARARERCIPSARSFVVCTRVNSSLVNPGYSVFPSRARSSYKYSVPRKKGSRGK